MTKKLEPNFNDLITTPDLTRQCCNGSIKSYKNSPTKLTYESNVNNGMNLTSVEYYGPTGDDPVKGNKKAPGKVPTSIGPKNNGRM